MSKFYNSHATMIASDEPTLTAIDKLHRRLVDHQLVRSCLNCRHFGSNDNLGPGDPHGTPEICGIYKARPPAEVIVYSCGPSWESDIPF